MTSVLLSHSQHTGYHAPPLLSYIPPCSKHVNILVGWFTGTARTLASKLPFCSHLVGWTHMHKHKHTDTHREPYVNKDRGMIVKSDMAGPTAEPSLGSMSNMLLGNQSWHFKTLGTGVCVRARDSVCVCVRGEKCFCALSRDNRKRGQTS